MLIAVPCENPGGLDAAISDHFGHSEAFTLVRLDDGKIGEVTVVPNRPHEEGGCLGPVDLLRSRGVEAMVAGGMGARPLAGFQDAGITVFFKEEAATVGEAVRNVADGKCREFGTQHTCGGHGGCGGHDHEHHGHHHHHDEIEREVVDGPVEKDRVVVISFKMLRADGELFDSVEGLGYLHGAGRMVAGLETALEGHVAGDEVVITLPPEETFGARDETRLLRVPADKLPAGAQVGAVIQARTPDGGMLPLRVVAIEGAEATLDANHPLAGETLTFQVKVEQVLKAAPEDLADR